MITQRPVSLSPTALSQCNTHIILRVTNPNDLDNIQKSAEGIDSNTVKNIPSLRVGEAIVVGEAVNHPLFITVRRRKTELRDRHKNLKDLSLEFAEMIKQKEDRVESFL